MRKLLILLVIVMLSSCSQEPEDNSVDQWPRQNGVLGESQQDTTTVKNKSSNHLLKGYQDNIQRAKDMEKEVLKAAQKQRKAIDG
jgi:tRNA A-37 threonylcarbamoyl transferase component Bud32